MKYKILYIIFFFLQISKIIFAQPINLLEIKDINPKWLHYSFSPDLPRFLQLYEPEGQPLIIENNMYLLHNITNNNSEGYFVESLDLETGKRKWHDSYYAKSFNTRRWAVPLNENNGKIGMYYFKEWNKTKPFLFWQNSRFNKIDYCIENGEKCDSIITDVNDSLNTPILMSNYIFDPFRFGTSLFSFQGKTQYVEYSGVYNKDKKTNSVPFKIYNLDNLGHKIDTNYFEIPTKYNVQRVQLKEYESGKRILFISSANSNSVSTNKEVQLVYFDSAFNIEKIIDITNYIPKFTACHVSFIDKNYILIGSAAEISPNTSIFKIGSTLLKISGEFIQQTIFNGYEINNKTVDSYALTFLAKKQQVVLAKLATKGTEKIAEIISTDNNSYSLKKRFKMTGEINISNLFPIGDSSLICRFKYVDSSSRTEYDNAVKWSIWVMFPTTSLGFNTSTKDIIEYNKVNYYPNPAHNLLHINSEETYDEIKVFSVEGRLIQYSENQYNTLNVSELPSGLYFFQLFQRGKAISKMAKFVKLDN